MLTPGTRLGVYEVVAAIGAGGTGEVYRMWLAFACIEPATARSRPSTARLRVMGSFAAHLGSAQHCPSMRIPSAPCIGRRRS
jgi:hypothetical protein